jgi:hypothetical protein
VNRRHLKVIALIVATIAGVLLALVCWRKREALQEAVPEWLASNQPPTQTIVPELLTVSPEQSYAANRCRPMAASCGDFTAGRRTRRIYPDTLESDPNSLVRAHFEIGGSI